MRVGQPGVEREERHLDGEGQRERREEIELLARAEVKGEKALVGEPEVPGLRLHLPREVEDGDQHEQAAGHRVQHELDGRIDAPRATPDADQERHRDEHDLPEDVEEEEVEREERAEHARLEDEKEREELLHPAVDVAPRREHDERGEKGGQQDEEEAHAVHSQPVLDPPCRDPRRALDQLEVRLAGPEAREEPQREREGHEREDERGAAHGGERLARQEGEQHGTQERREDEQREERHGQRPT